MKKTDDAILDAASRHFAEYGFEGSSLRAILRDAGVNAAAAHYHFGSKEAVYRATVERQLVPLTEERQRAFEALQLNDPDPAKNLALLIRAYVAPHLRLCADPEAHPYLKIISRFGYESKSRVEDIYREIIDPTRQLYLKAVHDNVKSLDLDTVHRLFGWVALVMSSSPFELSYESMSGQPAMPKDVDKLIDQVVAMCCGGILAVAGASDNPAPNQHNEPPGED